MNQRLVALHGFAGLPSDWSEFEASWPDWPLYKLNLFLSAPQPFDEWASQAAAELAAFEGRQVVLGYSLGGRLGAHLLLKAPQVFAGAIFVSTNPGLSSELERFERRRSDAEWAMRWRTSPWSDLLKEWNEQPVFQPSRARLPVRHEADFDRSRLASAMTTWSLAEQADLREPLAQSAVPQLWMAGAHDQKFVKLAQEMAQLAPQIQSKALPRAAHRAPWDAPSSFVAAVSSFLESL